MPLLIEVALGGASFSLLSSLAAAARYARETKSPYQKWLAEISKLNVVRDRP